MNCKLPLGAHLHDGRIECRCSAAVMRQLSWQSSKAAHVKEATLVSLALGWLPRLRMCSDPSSCTASRPMGVQISARTQVRPGTANFAMACAGSLQAVNGPVLSRISASSEQARLSLALGSRWPSSCWQYCPGLEASCMFTHVPQDKHKLCVRTPLADSFVHSVQCCSACCPACKGSLTGRPRRAPASCGL